MTGHEESEIKYSLFGRDDHQKLVGPDGLKGAAGVELQKNHYLDTRDLRLAGGMAMIRLRTSSGGAILTFKRGSELEAGVFRATEVEAPLEGGTVEEILRDPKNLYALPIPPVEAFRSRFGEPDLLWVGVLVNERKRFRDGRFLAEVDRMVFPDGSEEYEVEVETEDLPAARTWLLEEFERLRVRARPSRLTKLARLAQWIKTHPDGNLGFTGQSRGL